MPAPRKYSVELQQRATRMVIEPGTAGRVWRGRGLIGAEMRVLVAWTAQGRGRRPVCPALPLLLRLCPSGADGQVRAAPGGENSWWNRFSQGICQGQFVGRCSRKSLARLAMPAGTLISWARIVAARARA